MQGQKALGALAVSLAVAVTQRDAENGSLFPVSNCWAGAAR